MNIFVLDTFEPTVPNLLTQLGVYLTGGLVFGLATWHLYEKEYRRQIDDE